MNQEEIERKRLNRDIAYKISLLIVLIIGLAVFLWILKTQGLKCHQNPFVYGASQLAEEYEGSVSCSCQITGTEFKTFSFTDKEFNPSQKQIPNIDYKGG